VLVLKAQFQNGLWLFVYLSCDTYIDLRWILGNFAERIEGTGSWLRIVSVDSFTTRELVSYLSLLFYTYFIFVRTFLSQSRF
jgi:hypothetical protein